MFYKKTMLLMVIWISALLMTASVAIGTQNWPQTIKVGLIPTESSADIIQRFKPLMDHLESTLGVKVEPFSALDYAGIITAMAHKHIDFAYFGPKSYVEASTRANAQALAIEVDKSGAQGYYGVIITRKGSGIENLDQAVGNGHTFAFTDPNSTSGCLAPSVLFYRDLKTPRRNCLKRSVFPAPTAPAFWQSKTVR